MKRSNGVKRLPITEYLRRFLLMLLCMAIVSSVITSYTVFSAEALESSVVRSGEQETREEIKARLLEQIKNDGWDPYSEDMTLEEFYALMEMFDEGTLPLESDTSSSNSGNSGVSSPVFGAPGFDEPGIEEPSATADGKYIPRTKFLFAGLSNYERRNGSTDAEAPQDYDTNYDYEQIIGAADGEQQFYYPHGLDPYNSGYKRPPESWSGIEVTDEKTNRVVLVSEGINNNDPTVAGDVIQDLFAKYTGYYVKQVTIDGANINVLGMIDLGDRCIYYYLSAEGQSTQVSTTTLPDESKFIIEYVPVEHQVKYQVKLNDEAVTDKDVTNEIANGVVFYGSDGPMNASWVDGIFGASRPNRTTDGAYSFDVVVPYGYELQILISIEMTVDIPYKSKAGYADSFHVEINHTGTKDNVKKA